MEIMDEVFFFVHDKKKVIDNFDIIIGSNLYINRENYVSIDDVGFFKKFDWIKK